MQEPPHPSDPAANPLGAQKGDPAAMRRFGLVAGGGGILAAVAIAVITGQDPGPPQPAPPSEIAAPQQPMAPGTSPQPLPAPDAGEAAPATAPQTAAPQSTQRSRDAGPPATTQSAPGRPPAFCPAGEDRPMILVAFERSHPMHEAQRLFADGRRQEARELAGRLLAERRELRGLCLQRFSIGGAEIHVGAPSAATVTDWVERLSKMDGVERAEAELIAAPF
jgi:hypothetical protein